MVVAAGEDVWRSLAARAAPLELDGAGGWLILCPHPDDETLGAGGLIASLAARHTPAWIVFLTSGEASHIGAVRWKPTRVARTRRREAHRALNALGHPNARTIHLGWRDGNPPPLGGAAFRRSCQYLAALCRSRDIRNIATTWRGEAHCDHRAAYEIGAMLMKRCRTRLFEYIVWGWTDRSLEANLGELEVQSLDISTNRKSCETAIQQHRTQVSPLIRGARKSFRLASPMIALASRNPLILMRGVDCYAP
jgi:LmbE family N-acetylglucosaminyl deacetylase